jgi:hypothetical protein
MEHRDKLEAGRFESCESHGYNHTVERLTPLGGWPALRRTRQAL